MSGTYFAMVVPLLAFPAAAAEGPNGSQPATRSLHGQVRIDGEPGAGAVVTLYRADAPRDPTGFVQEPLGLHPTAETDKDGKYKVADVLQVGDDKAAVEYVVTVVLPERDGRGKAKPGTDSLGG